MQIKRIINKNLFTLLLFSIIFMSGASLYQDYGISFDEKFHRTNASFWYKYAKDFLLDPNSPNVLNSEKLIKQKIEANDDLVESVPSIQLVPLVIISEFFIEMFDIKGSKNIYQFKHFFNFFIYFIGLYFFYKLIAKRYKSHLYPLLGVLLLFLTPRIFAESFYNQKDIFFLSMIVINMYTGTNFLKNPNFKNTFAFSLSSALTIDTRIIGVISVIIVLFFFLIKSLRSKKFVKNNFKFVFCFIPLTFFFLILFWPYLWHDPFNNLLFAFSKLSSVVFGFTNLYAGKFILSSNIPWHYPLVWIAITTPIIVILLFLFGLFFILKRTLTRIIELDENFNDIWRGENEMLDIYYLSIFLLSIIIYIKKGLGYDGWRHLYFIYPSMIMTALFALYYWSLFFKSTASKIAIFSLIILNLTYLVFWNYKYHPHQYVYFNLIFKSKFYNNYDMDYWGISNRTSLEYIINNNLKYPIKIITKSFSSLEMSSLILSEEDKSKISITHNLNEADFIINTYRPLLTRNFVIDNNKYKKYYEVVVDNKPINTVYKKIE